MVQRRRRYAQPTWMIVTLDYFYLVVGCLCVALSFNLFVFPNKIASGGVSGISTIIGHVTMIEPGYIQWGVNIPLFLLAFLLLGKKFGVKTLIGTTLYPFFVVMTAHLEPVTHDPFLAALFGGIGIGAGLGLVFRGKASTGGTALAAQLLQKYTGLTTGVSLFMIDGLIVIVAALVFNIELGLYALIAVYLSSKTIDLVQIGLGYARVALIISDKQQEVTEAVLYQLDRGVTKLSATGGFTGTEREVLMCVVNQTEVTKLKVLVREIDPDAFVVVTHANEVLGEGF